MADQNTIILHNYPQSPVAEKVRAALGIKQAKWASVEIPRIPPKPLLTQLTGGYRRTPVMQIGADINCDTQRIATELEARFPEPTLFPGHSRGLSIAVSHWSDAAFFQPGSGLSLGTNEALPEDIQADRRAFFSYMDFDTLEEQLPHLFSQFSAHLHLLERMLDDNRPYLGGAQVHFFNRNSWYFNTFKFERIIPACRIRTWTFTRHVTTTAPSPATSTTATPTPSGTALSWA